MNKELKGDYECDECGYTTHNSTSRICHNCGGELVYMMTWQDEIEVLTKERNQLKAENKQLKEALGNLFDRCMKADEQGELSELISGELLDSVGTLLGYTSENAVQKEREFLETIAKVLNEVTK